MGPLLMYSTGSHFQSVLQNYYEYFVHLAKKLQDRNICQMCPRERQLDVRQLDISHGSIMQISRGKEEDLVKYTMNLDVKESVQNLKVGNPDDVEFEKVRNIRKKDRTTEQQRLFDRISKKRKREKESPDEKATRQSNDKKHKANVRGKESRAQRKERQMKEKEQMKDRRSKESPAQRTERQLK